ncbi:MAG: hypothetical protein K2J29_04750 [Muribaculaceae bacterium]|nr:hypothetical protein [Bacteroides sp.]MDE6803920.1 hypothetical protein [Muribaculaceae bacterium]MDE7189684.1 hypothetical protein [Muribaculaceae bacterium]
MVCTGSGTGQATPFEKVKEFKSILGDFPIIVGAGVTDKTAAETAKCSDGAIGSRKPAQTQPPRFRLCKCR